MEQWQSGRGMVSEERRRQLAFEERLHSEILGALLPLRAVSMAGAAAGLFTLATPAAVLLVTVLISQLIGLLAALPYVLSGWPLEQVRLPSGAPVWLRGRLYPSKGLFDFDLLLSDVAGLLLWVLAAGCIGAVMGQIHRWFMLRHGILDRGNPDTSPLIEVVLFYVLSSPWALLATAGLDPTLTCFFLLLYVPLSRGLFSLWLWAYRRSIAQFAGYPYTVRALDVMRRRAERSAQGETLLQER